jgi:hypothetical protein
MQQYVWTPGADPDYIMCGRAMADANGTLAFPELR